LGSIGIQVVAAGQMTLDTPVEVGGDKIGYLTLELVDEAASGLLLGFCTIEASTPIWRDMDEFVVYLSELQVGLAVMADLPFELPLLPTDVAARVAMVAQLERLYREVDADEWKYEAADILRGQARELAQSRGDVQGEIESAGVESMHPMLLKDLSGQLMGLLAAKWRELGGD
jgi:hypothetical protein